MRQTRKPMLVQALVAKSAVQRFDIRVLIRFAGLNQPQGYPMAMSPGQHRFTGELRSVVGADNRGLATLRADPVQNASQVIAADRMFRNNGNYLMRSVIDDHQVLERTTRGDAIKHKVHGPDLVAAARTHERLPIGNRDLLAPATLDMQLLEAVEPFDTLMVDDLAGLTQL